MRPSLALKLLVTNLCALDETPWAEWRRGEKPITARGVALLLKPFGIVSKHTRVVREYHRNDFEDAWKRYLPSLPRFQASQPSHAWKARRIPIFQLSRPHRSVTYETSEDLIEIKAVTLVTVESGFLARKGQRAELMNLKTSSHRARRRHIGKAARYFTPL